MIPYDNCLGALYLGHHPVNLLSFIGGIPTCTGDNIDSCPYLTKSSVQLLLIHCNPSCSRSLSAFIIHRSFYHFISTTGTTCIKPLSPSPLRVVRAPCLHQVCTPQVCTPSLHPKSAFMFMLSSSDSISSESASFTLPSSKTPSRGFSLTESSFNLPTSFKPTPHRSTST